MKGHTRHLLWDYFWLHWFLSINDLGEYLILYCFWFKVTHLFFHKVLVKSPKEDHCYFNLDYKIIRVAHINYFHLNFPCTPIWLFSVVHNGIEICNVSYRWLWRYHDISASLFLLGHRFDFLDISLSCLQDLACCHIFQLFQNDWWTRVTTRVLH